MNRQVWVCSKCGDGSEGGEMLKQWFEYHLEKLTETERLGSKGDFLIRHCRAIKEVLGVGATLEQIVAVSQIFWCPRWLTENEPMSQA